MSAVSAIPLPACCRARPSSWPWPVRPAGLELVALDFDPQRLREDDWHHCGLTPIKGAAKRQTEFLAGRLCAHEALRRLGGSGRFPERAPSRAPIWPEGCCGAITHSDGLAAAVVGRQSQWLGLGLDAETLLDAARARPLASELLTPEELAAFEALPAERQGPALTLAFSLKESLFKALNPLTGQRFYFQSAALDSLEMTETAGPCRIRLREDLHSDWPAGRILDGQFACLDDQLLTLIAIPAPGRCDHSSQAFGSQTP